MQEEAKVPFKDYRKLEDELDILKQENKKLKTENENLKDENKELKWDVEHWKEKYENEVQYRRDNFRMISEMEAYGLHEADFY